MTRSEAEELIAKTEGRLCVRFFQRKDGTVLTRDCPRRARLFRRLIGMAVCGSLALLGMVLGAACLGDRHHNPFRKLPIVRATLDCFDPDVVITGMMCPPKSRP
jgi:hypothetical protein